MKYIAHISDPKSYTLEVEATDENEADEKVVSEMLENGSANLVPNWLNDDGFIIDSIERIK